MRQVGSGGKDGGDTTVGDGNSGPIKTVDGEGGGDKGGSGQLRCPKCGDPCTHVETFVCKLLFIQAHILFQHIDK